MPTCPYDGSAVPVTEDGLEDACPACAADIAHHESWCRTCRENPNMPDVIGDVIGGMRNAGH